jgi:hypothetical protein
MVATKDVDAQVQEAQRKLREAIAQGQPERPKTTKNVGQKVDKYFGDKLPPVCEKLGCYLTDDGKRFYCVNATCQKHKKRSTKHSKVPKKGKGAAIYFRCPKCQSTHVDLKMFSEKYHCRRCEHEWPR